MQVIFCLAIVLVFQNFSIIDFVLFWNSSDIGSICPLICSEAVIAVNIESHFRFYLLLKLFGGSNVFRIIQVNTTNEWMVIDS